MHDFIMSNVSDTPLKSVSCCLIEYGPAIFAGAKWAT